MEQWNLSPQRVLRVLFWLRLVSLGLQGLVLWLSWWAWPEVQNQAPLALALVALAGFNGLVQWRLRKPWPATELEVSGHLLFDVMQFTVVLYFTGGATNPFVSLYLLPVALGAAALRLPYAALVALISTVAYSSLLRWHLAGASAPHHLGDNFNLHLWGMWLNFLLAAALLVLFVGMLARLLRSHEREIYQARERTLRDEGILAVGTLAAGAAHQLGTPLSTMHVLLEDWLDQDAEEISRSDVALLAQQVESCRGILQQMLEQVRASRGESGHQLTLAAFLADSLERWQVTRPELQVSAQWQAPTAGQEDNQDQAGMTALVRYDVTLAQALSNLLNNAADASLANASKEIRIFAWTADAQLNYQIHDLGRGLSPEQAASAQRLFRSAKTDGMGIGLALSNSTIERLQGAVSFHQEDGHNITWVRIPLASLAPREHLEKTPAASLT